MYVHCNYRCKHAEMHDNSTTFVDQFEITSIHKELAVLVSTDQWGRSCLCTYIKGDIIRVHLLHCL